MKDEKKERLDALKESVSFFSAGKNGEIELWTCNEFLLNLGIDFQTDELLLQPDDPPDVIFRGNSFEVKEVLDSGRRRHAEYKEALSKAQKAKDTAALYASISKNVTPEDITPIEISYLIAEELEKLVSRKYVEPKFRATLNLLFYVNLERQFLKAGPMPSPDSFSKFGFQSVSVLMGWGALVYSARSNAPDFVLAKVGTVTFRKFPRRDPGV